MNQGCHHSKIGPYGAIGEGRHCAFMECTNYVSKCPLHAMARTGDICSLKQRSLWLFEVEELDDSNIWPFTEEVLAKVSSERSWWKYIASEQANSRWLEYERKDLNWVQQSEEPKVYQLFMKNVPTAYTVREIPFYSEVITI